MGRNATRAQQAKARVREARLVLLSERQAQDERIEEATVRTVLASEDVVTAQARASRNQSSRHTMRRGAAPECSCQDARVGGFVDSCADARVNRCCAAWREMPSWVPIADHDAPV